jgi:tetratricopeptide (TPR) repeat protein
MKAQKTESRLRIGLTFSILAFVVGLAMLVPSTAAAQDALLKRAFGELQAERYDAALETLDRALGQARSSAAKAKVTYYRGFALEKLGRCDAAELAYRRVLDGQSGTKLGGFAREALQGFGDRCVVATDAPVQQVREVELPRGSGRVGWKVFGWTTMILGGLTLAALPVKNAIERDITSQAEPYFQLQYNCAVDNGAVSGERCDLDGLQKDPAYIEYDDTLQTANQWSDVIKYSGIGLVGLGATTLLLVAVTRPDADDVVLSVAPTGDGGAIAGALVRF